MFEFLARIFIKKEKKTDTELRTAYGVFAGLLGVALNLLLFGGKLFVGIMSGAISVIADAFNNLTDIGSSFISMAGIKLANKPVDADHPFGHGRIEYVASLIVSLVIALVGVEVLKSSVEKIFSGESPDFEWTAVIILGVSVLIKLWMYLYNRNVGRRLKSPSMTATAADSLSDCAATSSVLVSVLFMKLTAINVDSYLGILISGFILFSAYKSAKGTIDVLIGAVPDKALTHEIKDFVLSHKHIVGVHDLIVHNYGPNREIISLHAEVPSDIDISEAHDIIDTIENEMNVKFRCITVIHMDPIVVNDKRINELKDVVTAAVTEINPEYTIHDFRMTEGKVHINLIFDLVVPYGDDKEKDEVLRLISQKLKKSDARYKAVVKIENSFV